MDKKIKEMKIVKKFFNLLPLKNCLRTLRYPLRYL